MSGIETLNDLIGALAALDRVPLSEANLDRVGRKERQAAQGRLFPGCNPFDCERSHG